MDQLYQFAQYVGVAGSSEAAADGDAFLLDGSEQQLSEEERYDQIDSLLQKYTALLEYERLQDLVPPGVYVMPCFESLLTWHGVLFAREGLYRGGVFKFQLSLPDNYPEGPPDVRFLSNVFHPMVDPTSGRVDLGIFPEWRAGRDYASFALPHLQRALLRREYFAGSARPPLNAEARELFLNDPAAFAERAAECARRSVQKAYENPLHSPLQFTNGPVEAHDKILENLNALDSTYSIEDRRDAFLQWFCDHYSHEQPAQARVSRQIETIHFDADTSPRHAPVSIEGDGSPAAEIEY